MSAIKWFRKNNKKLLAVFGVLLMVGFLLPNLAGRGGGRGPREEVLAYYVDQDGQEQEITTITLGLAKRELDLLRAVGIGELGQRGVWQQVPALGGMGQLAGLGGVGGVPVLALQQLFFADSRFSPMFRADSYVRIERGDWATDRQQKERLIELIDVLSNSDPSEAALYYVLLREEARKLGIKARADQIDEIIKLRKHPDISQVLGRFSIASLTSRQGVTSKDLRRVIGNYIAIVRAGQVATNLLNLSEPELQRDVLEDFELGNLRGDYVIFAADTVLSKVSQPQGSDLEGLFAKYRQSERGSVSQENPHGLGYMLGDRVQVEYLAVDLREVEDQVASEFRQRAPRQQEDTIQKYWRENRDLFREMVPAPLDQQGETEQPTYRDPDYDEIAGRAQLLWQRNQARTRGEQVLAEAKRIAAKAIGGKDFDELVSDELADYAEMVEQLDAADIAVTYGKSDYLSPSAAADYLDLGNAFLMRKQQRQKGLLNVLFDCKPLHEGAVARYDLPPASLYEDIGPVVSFDPNNNATTVYLLRIIDIDKKREALSLDDDGRQGPADREPTVQPEGSDLVRLVEEDWQRLQAFRIAQEQAERFAEQAKTSWHGALAASRSFISGDPCDTTVLEVASLAMDRDRVEQMAQVREQAALFAGVVARYREFLREVAEHAAKTEGKSDNIDIIVNPDQYNCIVFKDLSVTEPSQGDYLARRALTAREQLLRKQQIAALTHYNPKNIKQRNGFRIRTLEDEP